MVEKLTDVEDSFRCLISSRWIGTATKTVTTEIGLEILSSTNSLVDVARLHCNIEDKAGVLNKLVQIMTNLCCLCSLLPLPGPCPTSTLRQTRSQYPSLPPKLLRHQRPHSSQSTAPSSRRSYPGVCTISFSGILTMVSSAFLQSTARGRGILKAPSGLIEGEKLIELELGRRTRREIATTRVEGTVVSTVGLEVGKLRSVVQEPDDTEHDVLQAPEHSVWLSTIATSPSCIVPLLLKLAYYGQNLQQKVFLCRRKRRSGQTAYRSR